MPELYEMIPHLPAETQLRQHPHISLIGIPNDLYPPWTKGKVIPLDHGSLHVLKQRTLQIQHAHLAHPLITIAHQNAYFRGEYARCAISVSTHTPDEIEGTPRLHDCRFNRARLGVAEPSRQPTSSARWAQSRRPFIPRSARST
jgi:hypothetical protein